MIKEARKQKLIEWCEFPMLTAVCLNFINQIVWDKSSKTRLNELTRGKYNQNLIKMINDSVEKAVEQSFYHIDHFDNRRAEKFLYESMKKFMIQKHIEEYSPSQLPVQDNCEVKKKTKFQLGSPLPIMAERRTLSKQ